MMNKSREEYLNIAESAATLAGKYLLSRFGEVKEIRLKEEKHWTVDEDGECNKIYSDYLEKYTPEAGQYLEEGSRDLTHKLTWVVDPIEGTSNFRAGIPFYATQICLLEAGEPTVAVIYSPCYQLKYTAIKDKGAYLNGKKISVGNEKLNRALVAIDKGHDNQFAVKMMEVFAGEARTLRWFGALGLNMALVASGGIDLFINKGSDLYDYAAGVLMVREAGGKTANLKNENWSIENKEIVAGNEEIVTEAVKIISNNIAET